MLLVQVALSDLGFGLGGTEATGLEGLRRAAQKAHAIHTHRLRARPGPHVQRAERWQGSRRPQARPASPDGARTDGSAAGRQGGWSRCAPALRLLLAVFVAPRPLASAWQRLPMTAAVVGGVPCFCRDGFRGYLTALLAVSHALQTLPRPGQPGRPKPPGTAPHPELGDGQGSKKKPQGRLQERVARGRGGATRLAALGLASSPSWLARLHLTRRQALAPLVRKSGSCGKDRFQRRRRVVCWPAFDNCARPHRRVPVPWPAQAPQATGLIQPQWHHRTPGMAAGLPDHVWTFRALLTAKVEPLHRQSGSG